MHGGFDPIVIKPTDFKYTIDNDRKIWTSNNYSAGIYLLEVIKEIKWHEYTYNGPSTFLDPPDDDDEATFNPNIDVPTTQIQPTRVCTIQASYPPINPDLSIRQVYPYKLFGGCCYEVLNMSRPGVKLHDIVDPTGDLDVRVYLPNINFIESDKDFPDCFYPIEELDKSNPG